MINSMVHKIAHGYLGLNGPGIHGRTIIDNLLTLNAKRVNVFDGLFSFSKSLVKHFQTNFRFL